MDLQQLVALRTDVKELKAKLRALDDFKEIWNNYALLLLDIVKRLEGHRALPESDTEFVYLLNEADDVRNSLRARMATVLGGVRQPMSTMLSQSLRATTDNLVDEFLVAAGEGAYNSQLRAFSIRRAQELIADCDSILEEKRLELEAGLRRQKATLEESESVVEEDRKHELEKIRAAHPPGWPQLRSTWLGRFVVWLWKATWGKVLSGAVIVAVTTYLVPPLRNLALALWHSLRGPP